MRASEDGPLLHKTIEGAHVLTHACGTSAPLLEWRVTREAIA